MSKLQVKKGRLEKSLEMWPNGLVETSEVTTFWWKRGTIWGFRLKRKFSCKKLHAIFTKRKELIRKKKSRVRKSGDRKLKPHTSKKER